MNEPIFDPAARAARLAPAPAAPTQSGRPPVKWAALRTGITVPYVETGSPIGVPVVMLHGTTDSWFSFSPVLPHLPDSLRAIAMTLRGHGDADRPPAGYRMPDMSADVAALLDALGIDAAVIVGHSMGASIAQRFALDHPGRVRGLVLAASFASFRDNPVVTDFWQTSIVSLADPVDPALAREFQQSTLARPVPAAFVDAVVRESLKVPARVWRAAFEGMLADDGACAFERITAPTLIVWGDRDAFVPRADPLRLHAGIAGSRLVVYPDTGHALHWEMPERFAADLTEFVRGT